MKFHSLLFTIHQSSQHIDIENFKFQVQCLLTDDQSTTVMHYLDELKKLTTSNDVLLFLKTRGFIGYQNYELLEYIVSCLLEDNLEVVAEMDEYIKKYEEFEQELSLSQLEGTIESEHEQDDSKQSG